MVAILCARAGDTSNAFKVTPVALLMRAYGHASETQTLEYLCIQPKEIRDLYLTMEL